MRSLLSNEPADNYFIFDSLLECFYHIFIEAPHRISQLPFKELQAEAKHAYETCNGSVALPPNYPSPEAKAAMTDQYGWGREFATNPPRDQLKMYFDPQYSNSSFISCFNNTMTEWVNQYTETQTGDILKSYAILVGCAVLLAIVCGTVIVAYNQYRENRHLREWDEEKRSTLFQNRRTEKTPLLDDDVDYPVKMDHPAAPINKDAVEDTSHFGL